MTTNNPTVSTPDQASKPSLFCPCCGQPAKVDYQSWYVKPGGYWLVTCLQSKYDCAIGEATASAGSLQDGTFLRSWKVEALFDLVTGEAK